MAQYRLGRAGQIAREMKFLTTAQLFGAESVNARIDEWRRAAT
jgi:hypothetical protein